MLGYWEDEAKTRQEITESRWFKSGLVLIHKRIISIERNTN